MRFEKLTEDLPVVKKILGLGSLRILPRNRSIVRRISADEVDDEIRNEVIKKYRRDYDLISKLDSFNSSGLKRFKVGMPSVTHVRVMSTLKSFIIRTSLEKPTRFLFNYIKKSKKS